MDSDGEPSETTPEQGDEMFTVASGTNKLIVPIMSAISQAVAEIPSLVPVIAPVPADSSLAAEDEDKLAWEWAVDPSQSKGGVTSECKDSTPIAESAGWPSVSSSEEEENIKNLKQGLYPKIYSEPLAEVSDSSSGIRALDHVSSTIIKNVKEEEERRREGSVDEETLKFLHLHDPSHLGDYQCAEDILDNEALEDLGAGSESSLDDDILLSRVGPMLDTEGREFQRSGLTQNLEELECSSGSAFRPGKRELNDNLLTHELPDDWLRVDDVTGTSYTMRPTPIDLGKSPVKSTSSRESGTRKVYTFPKREDELLAAAEEGGSQVLAWPVGLLIQVIGFQMKLLVQLFYFSLWVCTLSYALVMFPIRTALKASSMFSTTARDGYILATNIKPIVKDGVALAGPIIRQTTKKCGCGCLAAVYVMFMLGSLLLPALFLDLFLMHGVIEDPVEVQEVLHFDYTQEHPSAYLSLLPQKVQEKVKDTAKSRPDKLHHIRAIPASHKFHVTLFLTLPESEYNQRLGMFQVRVELLSVTGQVIRRTSRPCMLRFRSSPVRYAKNVLRGVPLLMGYSWESQMLTLRIFENEDGKKVPITLVRFVLEPKAGNPVGAGLPEVYSAEAQVLSVLPWTKELVRNWKWTFYVWGGLSLFMFEVLIILCCCHQVLLPSKLLRGITEGFEEPGLLQVPIQEAAPRKGAKHGRRVNFSDELPSARFVRLHNKPADKTKERDLLFCYSDSSTTLTGPKSRQLSGASAGDEDRNSEATSSWRVPPLEETLEYVDDKVKVVEDTVRNVGGTVVEGVAGGVGLALHKMKGRIDPKALKSD